MFIEALVNSKRRVLGQRCRKKERNFSLSGLSLAGEGTSLPGGEEKEIPNRGVCTPLTIHREEAFRWTDKIQRAFSSNRVSLFLPLG